VPDSPAPARPAFATSGSALRALRSRNFAILWVGNLLSNTGTWMQQVAEPWLVLRLSNSPFLLGLDSFMMDAPIWLLILAGGIIADRRDRRRTALFFQGIQVVCPILIVVLLATSRIQVWMVIALSLVVGVTDALSAPSINALVPSSVPEDDVASAVALNSAQFNLSRVLGPFFAGVVMATLGPIVCFALNASSYAPYLLAIYLLRIPARPSVRTPAKTRTPSAQRSLLEAVAVLAKKRRLRRALLTVLITSVFGMPMVTFIPVLVRDAFHLGSTEFGGALSVFGFGGLVGAALVLPLKTNRHRQILSNLAALGLSALIVAMSLDRVFAIELTLLFFIGAAMVASNTAANSILQSSIDGRVRGRVSSMYTLAVRGGAPLGSLATGIVTSHWGVRTALFVNGALAFLCHGALIRRARRRTKAKREAVPSTRTGPPNAPRST
jgi:predicted MFS family arabinose efflux permease